MFCSVICYPDPPDTAEIENYWRTELAHDEEILKTKAHEESALIGRFMAYSKLLEKCEDAKSSFG
ncbi:MAG TPA: hypothetical protein VHZ55_07240 [Bryobacteraceae bacterium]|jgi:hypothetical protein|nr:hypothetical protein [Bryobacteraceae bacterium]